MVSFPQVSSSKPCTQLSSLPIRATCPAHLIHPDFITRTIFGEQCRSLNSSLPSFLHSPVTSFLLGPNILLSTIFSNTINLRSSLNVNEQLSHPYKTTGKITVLYRGADNSLARPSSRCILFDGENISFDASLVIYIKSANIPPITIINRIYETQNLPSL